MQEIDVLVIGAGPAGTTLALELAAQKVSFRIIDKAPTRSDKSRALALQPRSLELLNRYGDARDIYSMGTLTPGPSIYVNETRLLDINLNGICKNSPFTLPLLAPQIATENFLDACLAKYGHAVERSTEAKDITQDADGVTVTLSTPGGKEEKIRAKYVVGTDGAHSLVRHSFKDVKFDGMSYPQEFVLSDAKLRNNDVIDRSRYGVYLSEGMAIVFPLNDGKVRVSFLRKESKLGAEVTKEEVQEGFDTLVPGGGELYDHTWLTCFRLHHRLASKYREGRLFISGDAAHLHSPIGGQGMNTGIQDAINLGWKLGMVLRGERPDSFLDTYNAERRPVGQQLINTADKTFGWLAVSHPVMVFLRNMLSPWIMPWLTRSPTFNEDVFSFMSEFGVNYRGSSLVATGTGISGPVLGGDRAPDGKIEVDGEERYFLEMLSPGTHHMVFFSGIRNNATTHRELDAAIDKFKNHNVDKAKVHTIVVGNKDGESVYVDSNGSLHKEYGLTNPSYIYIRPDGYVGHIGLLPNLDELMNWLK
ncbi:FAD binding domain-containing protein [Camillea tinctor]|nr:FAD binding domain-containing protein [Camillea tinctor]